MTNPHGEFVPDPLSPSGYRWKRHDEQPATSMLPIVGPIEQGAPDHADLELVDPDQFLSFDAVDSQMIRSIGAPE